MLQVRIFIFEVCFFHNNDKEFLKMSTNKYKQGSNNGFNISQKKLNNYQKLKELKQVMKSKAVTQVVFSYERGISEEGKVWRPCK